MDKHDRGARDLTALVGMAVYLFLLGAIAGRALLRKEQEIGEIRARLWKLEVVQPSEAKPAGRS